MTNIISFCIGIVILIALLKIFLLPFKVIVKFIFNSILGGILLAICAFFGIMINIYWWTIILVGLLGVPGFVIAVLITILI